MPDKFKIKKSKYSPSKTKNKDKNVSKKIGKHVIKQQVKKAGPLLGAPKQLVKRIGGPLAIASIMTDAHKLLQRKESSGTTYHDRKMNYMQRGKYDAQGLSDAQKKENLDKDLSLIKKRQLNIKPKKDITGKFIDRTMSDEGYLTEGMIMRKGGVARDYKKEYKKFQSSGIMKKYRAKLNKYNRDKGTYGNGDGLDASHKGGNIIGFESSSKNKGRAEKSRLKGSKRNYKKGGLPGLWANIRAKRKRIAQGSGEKMRKPGSPGAPTEKALKESQAKKGMIVIGISLKKKGKRGAKMNKKDCGCKH